MKKISKLYFALASLIMAIAFQSCVDADELTTPNVASPVLVLLTGSSFESDSKVIVNSKFLELDKTNILDKSIGIDSIPVANLDIRVFYNTTTEVAALTTDDAGSAILDVTWQELGLSTAAPGTQVRLEFTGTYKNIPFRRYHSVQVK